MINKLFMEEYLENLGIYYDEKVRFLSDILTEKKTNSYCGDCENKKEFIEDDPEKITFTCGSEKKELCGIQIIIEFPKYIYIKLTN